MSGWSFTPNKPDEVKIFTFYRIKGLTPSSHLQRISYGNES